MYNRILLGHDGSALADAAIPHVASLATDSSTEVLLVHVVPPAGQGIAALSGAWLPIPQPPVDIARDAAAYERAAALERLQRTAHQLRERGVQSVRSMVVEGAPDEAIIALGNSQQCDLIVIATRGHSGFRRMMQGSVAQRVLAGAHRPVLLVGPRAHLPGDNAA